MRYNPPIDNMSVSFKFLDAKVGKCAYSIYIKLQPNLKENLQIS